MVTNNQVFQNGNNKQQEASQCMILSAQYKAQNTQKKQKTPHWDPQRIIKQYSV